MMILDQDQIQEIILSLWENSAVLTKTAQQLYLHRKFSPNTRFDKWEELTGLQLKELTDLTFVLSIDFTRYYLKFCASCTELFYFLVTLP